MTMLERMVLMLLAAVLLACEGPLPDSKLVARVNGEAITRAIFESEVERMLERHRSQGQPPRPGIEQRIKESILRRMVDDLIIAQKAKSLAVAIAAPELEAKFEEYRKRFKTEEAFQDYLKRSYSTQESLKSDLKRNLLRERVVDRIIGRIDIGADEVRKYYEENKARFTERERVKASRIVLSVSQNAAEAERRKARSEAGSLRVKAIADGADFAALAKQWSKGPEAASGGDLGWLVRGGVPTELDAVFKVPPGAVSDVIETKLGYEIVKVWERKRERERALEDVKETIVSALRARKLNEKRREALQLLKDSAKVEQLFLL